VRMQALTGHSRLRSIGEAHEIRRSVVYGSVTCGSVTCGSVGTPPASANLIGAAGSFAVLAGTTVTSPRSRSINQRHQGVQGGGTLAEVEREHIIRVLRETGGVISAAAVRLNVPRTTLYALMRRRGITRDDL